MGEALRVRDFAWAAGIIDGEGSIDTSIARRHPRCRVVVSMSDEDIILRLLDKFGGAYHARGQERALGFRPMFTWTVSGWPAYAVLAACYPFFGERRQAKTREFILAYRSKPGKTYPHGYAYRRVA